MKKFTKILICFMLCVFGFSFVACDTRTPDEKAFTYPTFDAYVEGNGGLAVKKGNYIYFVNGYKDISDAENEEIQQEKSYTHGALMLTKLNADGSVAVDDEGLLKDEYYISMNNKLCGFNATSLFISGEYLYFTAQCQENEGGEDAGVNREWARDRIEFFRIKLDKSSSVEKLYQSQSTYENISFDYYENNGKVYILAFEKASISNSEKTNTLVRIDASNKQTKEYSNIKSVVMGENADEIFFVQNEDSSFKLQQYNIIEDKVTLFDSKTTEFSVDFVSNGRVFVSYTQYGMKYLDSSNVTTKQFETEAIGVDDFTLYVDAGVVMGVKGADLVVFNNKNTFTTITDSDAKDIKVIGFVNGSLIYYTEGDEGTYNIKQIRYSSVKFGTVESELIATVEDMDTKYFDAESEYMYFFKTIGEHTYLHRIKIGNRYNETEEMIGVYLEADIPEVEEETEETEG